MNCYNSELYLTTAIESVYQQTYQDWEIVFWDNNSNDNSGLIAKSFDEKLRYFKAAKTESLYTARNLALNLCRGEYIAFLDCDDIWVNSKLSKQITEVENGHEIVYGNYSEINESGQIIRDNVVKIYSGNITNKLFKRNPISIGCVLVKKSIIDEFKFDPHYDLLGDYDLWVQMSLKYNIFGMPDVLEYSRSHPSNISKTLGYKWRAERRYFYKKHLNVKTWIKNPWLSYYIFKTEILGTLGRY